MIVKIVSRCILGLVFVLSSCSSDDDGQDSVTMITANGSGIVHLRGDLSNEEAATLIAENAGENTHTLLIKNTTNLQTLNVSGLTNLAVLEITQNSNLTALMFPELTTVSATISIEENSRLTTIDLDELTYTGTINAENNPSLSEIVLPKLEEATGLRLLNNDVMERIQMNQLKSLSNGIYLFAMPQLQTLSFANLTHTQGDIGLYQNELLTTVDLSSLITTGVPYDYDELKGEINVNGNAIVSLDLGSLESAAEINIAESALTTMNLQNLINSDEISITSDGTIAVDIDRLTSFSRLVLRNIVEIEPLLAQLVAISPPLTNADILLYTDSTISENAQSYIETLENAGNSVRMLE